MQLHVTAELASVLMYWLVCRSPLLFQLHLNKLFNMSFLTLPIQTASISISLLAAGGIAALTFFDTPLAQAQPASRSLASIRWLFSRGSYVFPTASILSGVGFAYLAINAMPLPLGRSSFSILNLDSNGLKFNGYLAALALNFAICPFTILMILNNFETDEKKRGARSEKSAEEGQHNTGQRSTDDSVSGKGDPNQYTDLSLPQSQAPRELTAEEKEQVREMLGKFGRQNSVRAVLCGVGGIVGLVASLA